MNKCVYVYIYIEYILVLLKFMDILKLDHLGFAMFLLLDMTYTSLERRRKRSRRICFNNSTVAKYYTKKSNITHSEKQTVRVTEIASEVSG